MNELGVVGPSQKLILNKINTLPPSLWLANDCHTDCQRQHWHDCRQFFQFLHLLLKDYFSGKAPALAGLSKKEVKSWRQHRNYWLQVYSLISDAWEDISQEASNWGFEKKEFPETPGQMFIETLKWDAAALFYPCTEYASPEFSKFSPTALYKEWRRGGWWQVQMSKGSYISKEKFTEQVKFDAYLNFCLRIYLRVSKQDNQLRANLKRLYRLKAEIDQELFSMIHPSKGVKGHVWVNGEKKSLTKP